MLTVRQLLAPFQRSGEPIAASSLKSAFQAGTLSLRDYCQKLDGAVTLTFVSVREPTVFAGTTTLAERLAAWQNGGPYKQTVAAFQTFVRGYGCDLVWMSPDRRVVAIRGPFIKIAAMPFVLFSATDFDPETAAKMGAYGGGALVAVGSVLEVPLAPFIAAFGAGMMLGGAVTASVIWTVDQFNNDQPAAVVVDNTVVVGATSVTSTSGQGTVIDLGDIDAPIDLGDIDAPIDLGEVEDWPYVYGDPVSPGNTQSTTGGTDAGNGGGTGDAGDAGGGGDDDGDGDDGGDEGESGGEVGSGGDEGG